MVILEIKKGFSAQPREGKSSMEHDSRSLTDLFSKACLQSPHKPSVVQPIQAV